MSFWRAFKPLYEIAAEGMMKEIEEFLTGEKILDLGCGSGIFGKKIEEKLKKEVIGMDIVDKRICQIPFKIYDGKNIPFSNDYFDVVIIAFVLHHTEDPISILKEAKRVGKRIIIFEDLPEGILGKVYCFLHWISWNLLFGKLPKFNFHKTKEWEEIFKNLGLKLISEKDFLIKRKIFVLEK
jgi:ubiquinone/menaquinone biosynthesis C-methylase UbiE